MVQKVFCIWQFVQEICHMYFLPPRHLTFNYEKVKVCDRKVNSCDYWTPKVNHKFDSVWRNNLGKTKHTVAMEQNLENCDFASYYLKTHSEEKLNKCNQCDYASSRAGHLKTHLKTHSGESQTNANNATLHHVMKALWGHIWKHTAEKSQTDATNVTLHLIMQDLWGNTWKSTVEKSQTNATSVTMHPLRQVIWGHIWKHTVEKSQTKVTHGKC